MRIAIVAPGPDRIGGQGIQARILARQLERDGHSVTFVPIDPPFPAAIRWARRVPLVRTLLNEGLYLQALRGLGEAEVVHVFSAAYWSFLLAPAPALLAAHGLGMRIVLNYHSGEARDHLARWGRFIAPVLGLAHEIVVPSRYLSCIFARHGYRARVIPNVVDTSCFRYRRRGRLRPALLSTRNLEPCYRVNRTLEAFALVKRRHPRATLTISGSGSEESRLRSLAGRLGIEGVRFLGPTSPRAMPRLYDEADIFVNSSVVDNQPLSVMEAFASGTPVVSTAVGGIAELLRNGETGLAIPREDPPAMAGAITRLLEDPALAGRIARRARQKAEEHTWDRVREAWAEVYAGRAA